MKPQNNQSEEIFARLCAGTYYGGFVYRNPKYFAPTEKEAGDVILWVRDWLIIFEVIWRNPKADSNSTSFVKRVGEKRDQLLSDFKIYGDNENTIYMKNDEGEATQYNHDCFNDKTTRGVVLIDARSLQGQLHFETLRMTTEAPHPITVMTRSDFETILSEVDTPSDLGLYLGDRHAFLREVLNDDADVFLRLGNQLEQELMGLYKLAGNKFDVVRWKTSVGKRFWHRYQIERAEDIVRRDEENLVSVPLDELMSGIRKSNGPGGAFTVQHAWELALCTRRERTVLAKRIEKKISALHSTRREQKFAAKNNSTGCWDVFYFYRGVDSDYFRAEAQRMADRKLWVECSLNKFGYSVFCFAIRFSPISLTGIVEVVLTVSDASKCSMVTPAMLSEASSYFAGQTGTWPINEFPRA